jgi:predicted ATPase
MASPDHPIVLFLDDIQWIDEASSTNLLEIFLADADLQNVMLVVFACQDEEQENVQDLLELCTNEVIGIQLNHLDTVAVFEMVSAILASKKSAFLKNSRAERTCVKRRTLGNPFQFLDTIEQEGLLSMNYQGEWTFEVDSIQREMMISETFYLL